MPLSVAFPSWISPEIIPGLPFRWYGVMYLLAFAVAYLLFVYQARERRLGYDDDTVSGFFFWLILGLLFGARIFATIVYDTSGIYRREPWLVFWPFSGGKFTGLQGMSYHGGLIGAMAAGILYLRGKRQSIRDWGDLLVTGIPLGFTFGRLGNFINGELYGRITASPLGMVFPNAARFSTGLDWVRAIADQAGVAYSGLGDLINLPRHPSQLYEAFGEGVLLWLILWLLRKHKPFRGFMLGAYLVGFGMIRFIIEYFREPDIDLGYRITLVKNGIPPALYSTPFNFSTGQVLCFLMVLGGIAWWLIAARLPGAGSPMESAAEAVASASAVKTAADTATADEARAARRKLRKKLK